LTALVGAANIYFNYSGQIPCFDTSNTDGTGTLAAGGWDVLACNQLAMPTSMGKDSMFIEAPFDYDGYTKGCQAKYGITPEYDWAFKTFGGLNYSVDFTAYSNIIFSNGVLDPWMAGGVTTNITSKLPSFII
jgi:lysosomal Pro-X carboxypeptidase